MKPRLLVGLGNTMAGDDGIGLWIADRLRSHPRLPPDLDVALAGSDLLRAQQTMCGRERIILLDAVLADDGPDRDAPGTVLRLELDDLADHGASVHQLPPTAALALLRATEPALRDVPVSLIGVVIEQVRVTAALSPPLAAQLDRITEDVLGLVQPRNPLVAPARV